MTKKKSFSKKNEKIKKLSEHYVEILKIIGENPYREGLLKTPERMAKALHFLTQGYEKEGDEIIKSAIFHREDYQQMVVVKDMELYSLCEHHILPFFGRVHVAYIPNKKITGLSKIPRVVNVYARKLQVQERLTTEIKKCIHRTLNPLGVAVVIEARHLCMCMRGVENQNAVTVTSDFIGGFERKATREEFFDIIGKKFNL